MNEIKLNMPGFFDPGYEVITMKRGKVRTQNYRRIIIEIMLALGDQKPMLTKSFFVEGQIGPS